MTSSDEERKWRTLKIKVGNDTCTCHLYLSCYTEPTDPVRNNVQLILEEDDPMFERFGPKYAVVSTNMPQMPNPGPRQFYFKTWSENEGLLEDLVAAGAIRVVDHKGIPVNSWGSKAYQVELLWPDSDLEVVMPTAEEMARSKEDWQRFFGNTCIQHLGM